MGFKSELFETALDSNATQSTHESWPLIVGWIIIIVFILVVILFLRFIVKRFRATIAKLKKPPDV